MVHNQLCQFINIETSHVKCSSVTTINTPSPFVFTHIHSSRREQSMTMDFNSLKGACQNHVLLPTEVLSASNGIPPPQEGTIQVSYYLWLKKMSHFFFVLSPLPGFCKCIIMMSAVYVCLKRDKIQTSACRCQIPICAGTSPLHIISVWWECTTGKFYYMNREQNSLSAHPNN